MIRPIHTCTALFAVSLGSAQAPVVHFDFVSHNEEGQPWNTTPYYLNNRSRVLDLAGHFQGNGITWNMQSDHTYLSSVLSKETAALMANTGGINVLRWLHEELGVEMDPHAHESVYIYPDVVALMDSVGLPESKVIGGTIYNDYNGINLWMNLVNGQYGNIFPDRFWQPDYMMGGGTPNHVDDLNYYGFWNPQDTDNYLVHDPTSHLRNIGTGCSIKIQDTSTVAYVMGQVRDVVNNVQSGAYPAEGFYLQTIFFEQAGLNDLVFQQKVMDLADSVNAIVGTGVADWRTFKQAYTEWETDYNAQVFQWECGQVATAEPAPADASAELPQVTNVFTDHILVAHARGDETFELRDAIGRVVWAGAHIEQRDLSDLPSGSYLLKVGGTSAPAVFKVVKP